MRCVYQIAILGASLALAGCATNGTAPGGSSAASATAMLTDAGGASKGTASVSQSAEGLRLVVEATGLSQGAHGLHLHMTGRCDPPDFTSAGSHWNPGGKMHGRDNPAGLHLGDLPNLLVGTDGRGRLEVTIPSATLTGGATPLLDADGAALVVHAGPDDYKTDPSGNSGGRIACGVLAAG
jgi:superoxide dismutase, Cu-Zn family